MEVAGSGEEVAAAVSVAEEADSPVAAQHVPPGDSVVAEAVAADFREELDLRSEVHL